MCPHQESCNSSKVSKMGQQRADIWVVRIVGEKMHASARGISHVWYIFYEPPRFSWTFQNVFLWKTYGVSMCAKPTACRSLHSWFGPFGYGWKWVTPFHCVIIPHKIAGRQSPMFRHTQILHGWRYSIIIYNGSTTFHLLTVFLTISYVISIFSYWFCCKGVHLQPTVSHPPREALLGRWLERKFQLGRPSALWKRGIIWPQL